jgi:cytochrome c biogenesis protein CcdA
MSLFLLCFTFNVYSSTESSIEVFVYELPLQLNISKKDIKIALYNINEEENFKNFFKIVSLLYASNVPIIPENVCISCILTKGHTLEDIFLLYDTPLIGIFKDGKLAFIVIATTDEEYLNKILNEPLTDSVKVITPYGIGTYSLSNKEINSEIEELFLRGYLNTALLNLVFPTLSLAIADSINPCTFLVFTALLLLTLNSFGRIKTILVGISFISSVLIGYYILGLFLNKIMFGVPYIKYIVGIFGLIVSLDDILRGLKKEFNPRTPVQIRKIMSYFLQRAYFSPLFAMIMGFVASFTLLPCSGGPYVVSVSLMSVLRNSLQFYILLLIYNLVFVLPLVIILILIVFSRKIVKKIEIFRKPTKVKIIPLLSGIMLATICIFILIT